MAPRGGPALDKPHVGEFDYTVRVEVWLPLPHAEMLHTTALHHYDSKVRTSATCGPINAVRNVAMVTQDGEQYQPHRLSFGDVDTMVKALERPIAPGADGPRLVRETRTALLDALGRVNARSRELHDQAAASAARRAEREALLRIVKVWPRRTAVIDPDHTNAAGDLIWRVVQEHPDGLTTTTWVRGSSLGEALDAARFTLPYFPEEAFAP